MIVYRDDRHHAQSSEIPPIPLPFTSQNHIPLYTVSNTLRTTSYCVVLRFSCHQDQKILLLTHWAASGALERSIFRRHPVYVDRRVSCILWSNFRIIASVPLHWNVTAVLMYTDYATGWERVWGSKVEVGTVRSTESTLRRLLERSPQSFILCIHRYLLSAPS